MPTFNYPDYADDLRDIICSNPIITGDISASNLDERLAHSPTFPRIRNNSACTMDVDIVRNTLEGMAQNAVCGDLEVLRDRQFIPRSRERADELLRKMQGKLEANYRRWEVERIKRLISSKATMRYRIEVK
mgnify:CR=1 FL=1